MFLGTHTPKLDEKGRLFLPARFREELAEGVVITKGQERCLYVFKRADFTEQAAKLQAAPITAKVARDFGRMLFAGAVDDAPDKQGRVTVPAPLRSYAGLVKDCVVIGANTRLEIWDAATWASYEAEQDIAFAEQAEEVVPGLF
ncbi:MAG: cell division protein MraZ [Frankiales bacterium]|nr:cell division protein MraZ [Frankiales bacterium]